MLVETAENSEASGNPTAYALKPDSEGTVRDSA